MSLQIPRFSWIAAGVLLALSPPARAAVRPDWNVSLLSDSGVELVSDERVFTLFAAFNALGYDAALVARREPIQRPAFSALRAQVRASSPMPPALAQKFQTFLDAHPLSINRYLSFAEELGPAPDFAAGRVSGDVATLKGFEKLLAQYYSDAHLGQIYLDLAPSFRGLLEGYLPKVEGVLGQADHLLPPDRGTPPVIVVNWMDQERSSFDLTDLNPAVLVVGQPAGGSSGKGARDQRRGCLLRQIAGRKNLWPAELETSHGLTELIARAHRQGLPAGEMTPAGYLTSAYAYAVAAHSLPKGRSGILEQADVQGLWLTSEFDRLMQDSPPGKNAFDELTGERLAAMDLHKLGPPAPAAP